MVNPTTGWPWRTRSAATVELSTPPLMATAMGGSGMYGDSAEVRHGALERVYQCIHLLGGVAAAKRKTHAGARAFRRKTDGGEDVRGSHGAAGAGRAGGNGEAAEVQRDD